MLPELFRIPVLDLPVYTYGVLLTIAFIAALRITTYLAPQNGISSKRVYDLAMYIMPSALLGTRLLMISTTHQDVTGNLHGSSWSILLHSVGHYFGGFLTALVVSAILMRVWHMPWGKTADAIAPGLALGNVIGRIGCFAGGCCWGNATTSWIGVRFTGRANEINGIPIDVALIPTQLIEAALNLGIFIVLLSMWKRRAFDGQIILAHVVLYSLERFTVEFWRADPRGQIMSLSTAQFISAIILPPAMIIYFWLRNQAMRKSGVGYSH